MNKEDLKNKIETFYVRSLNIPNPNFLIGLDAIKSIIGIDLNQINTNLLDWFSDSINDIELSKERIREKITNKLNNLTEISDALCGHNFKMLKEEGKAAK